MIKNQRPRSSPSGDLAEFQRRRVERCVIALPDGWPALEAGLRVDLVDQDVTTAASLGDRRRGPRITRDDDRSIRRIEAVTEGLRPRPVRNEEGRHLDPLVLVDHAGFDLVHVDLVALQVGRFEPFGSDLHVGFVGLQQVLRHRLEPGRAEHLDRHIPLQHPGREDEVGVAQRVVGVEVRDEGGRELRGGEASDAGAAGRHGAPDDTRPEIDQVRCVIHDDGHAGPRAIGLGVGRARAQQHDPRPGRRRRRGRLLRRGRGDVRPAGERGGKHEHCDEAIKHRLTWSFYEADPL